MEQSFTLEYWKDGNWFVGRLVEIPSVFSQGETMEELEDNIREVYDLMTQDKPVVLKFPTKYKKIGISF